MKFLLPSAATCNKGEYYRTCMAYTEVKTSWLM